MRILATPLLAALVAVAGCGGDGPGQPTAEVTCSPTSTDRPVCPAAGEPETASFLDPTSEAIAPERIHLAPHVYVAPFAALDASRGSIRIGPESNVQDNVAVVGGGAPDQARAGALARLGLDEASGVETGERVILAHGSRVLGPARLGVGDVLQVAGGEGGTTSDSGVFVSFGAEVDGAVLERDSGLSALARVGPGVRLPSGFIVLPGKNVTTQAEAEDAGLGKVRPIVAADREFNAGVVEVNVGLAREYTRLYRDDATHVRGINYDPGGNEFDRSRDLPTVESDLCTGPQVREPQFDNRVIGDACFADSLAQLRDKMGRSISIRADEGGPFGIGTITRMGGGVIFHALEGTDLRTGDNVTYGVGVIVHGGGRPQVDPTTGLAAPTLIGDEVVLADGSIVFRSFVRNGARIGTRSAVVGSELALGQVIPDRVIYANDAVFGPVEW